MTEESKADPNANQVREDDQAAEHVANAHRILSGLRQRIEHSDLEEAIANLEMALSILTTKTGGML
jgi:hypothetical protein